MAALSRRDFFSRFVPKAPKPVVASNEAEGPQVAIIQGRHCLAYQKSFCSVCSERCPEPEAIITQRGIPHINADKCTGCRICYDVCPAPTNAILMTKKMQRAAPSSASETTPYF